MNISKTPCKKSRKPLVGIGSIVTAFILAVAGYVVSKNALIVGALAGIPTYIAPAYFAWKREPMKAYASAVLASMVSGSIAWIIVNIIGDYNYTSLDPRLAFISGLVTGGFASHLSSSAIFVLFLDSIKQASLNYANIAASFLAVSSSTTLGLIAIFSIRKPRDFFSPSVLLIVLVGLAFLFLTIEG